MSILHLMKNERLPKYDPLSERLWTVRNRLGYTQEQFASLLNVGVRTYVQWERTGTPRSKLAKVGIRLLLAKITKREKDSRYGKNKRAKEKDTRLTDSVDRE